MIRTNNVPWPDEFVNLANHFGPIKSPVKLDLSLLISLTTLTLLVTVRQILICQNSRIINYLLILSPLRLNMSGFCGATKRGYHYHLGVSELNWLNGHVTILTAKDNWPKRVIFLPTLACKVPRPGCG